MIFVVAIIWFPHFVQMGLAGGFAMRVQQRHRLVADTHKNTGN
jgi:hypothetical protein